MLGETKGTAAGGAEEAGKSLRVPGTNPFFPMVHDLQGNRFLELLEDHPLDVYLLNTGRVGGAENDDRSLKVRIKHSSAIVKGIAEGTIEWERDPDFGYLVATSVPGIDASDSEVLQPRKLYERTGRGEEYRGHVERLKTERAEFLRTFPSLLAEIVTAVGGRCRRVGLRELASRGGHPAADETADRRRRDGPAVARGGCRASGRRARRRSRRLALAGADPPAISRARGPRLGRSVDAHVARRGRVAVRRPGGKGGGRRLRRQLARPRPRRRRHRLLGEERRSRSRLHHARCHGRSALGVRRRVRASAGPRRRGERRVATRRRACRIHA